MNNIFKQTAVIALPFFLFTCLLAQDEPHDKHEGHHHLKNEINFAAGTAFIPEESEVVPGFHIHYVRGIGCGHRFAVGIGFESILDEHVHNAVSVIGEFRVWKGFKVAYAPGLVLPTKEHKETSFINHGELVYEFEYRKIHFGPAFGIAMSKDDLHLMPAVHVGTTF